MTAANGNFGDSAVHYFCVPYVINSQTNLNNISQYFKVYPNPTTSDLYINLAIQPEVPATLELYSTTGQLLQQKTNAARNDTFMISMQSYPAGVYFVRLKIGNEVATQKGFLSESPLHI